jgi:hypothetical protein
VTRPNARFDSGDHHAAQEVGIYFVFPRPGSRWGRGNSVSIPIGRIVATVQFPPRVWEGWTTDLVAHRARHRRQLLLALGEPIAWPHRTPSRSVGSLVVDRGLLRPLRRTFAMKESRSRKSFSPRPITLRAIFVAPPRASRLRLRRAVNSDRCALYAARKKAHIPCGILTKGVQTMPRHGTVPIPR